MEIQNFFSEDQKIAIQQTIQEAEKNTSGEIRVHIDSTCEEEPMQVAIGVFEKLGMQETAMRNGVLFYLALEDHKFAILGDQGINDAVPSDFWDSIRDEMLLHFKRNEFAEGLCKGIKMAGEKLQAHFPYSANDADELSNDISF